MRKKKISVIIPNYNNEKYIEKCLESILNQNYKNIEIIFIDDGSSDLSVSVAKNILSSSDVKYSIIEQYNQNASVARNRGIEIATGDYVYFLDSDDYIASEDVFQNLITSIGDCDLVIGKYNIINEEGEEIGVYDWTDDVNDFDCQYKYCNVSPNPSNKFYDLKIIKKHNLYFSNVRIGQDLNFYLKYLLFCENIITVDFPIYNYRFFQSNMSNTINFRIMDIKESIGEVKKFYQRNNSLDLYKKYITTAALKNYHVQLAKVYKFKDKKARKLVYNYFDYCIYENSRDVIKNDNYKREYKKYLLKKYLLRFNLYKFYKIVKEKNNAKR